jgi:hypothetical protein
VLEPLYQAVDAALGVLSPEQWEAWRGWATTVGGIAAVGIALSTYRLNARLKNEEQARKVYTDSALVKTYKAGAPFSRIKPIFRTHEDVGSWVTNSSNTSSIVLKADAVILTIQVHNRSDEIIGPFRVVTRHVYRDGLERTTQEAFGVLRPLAFEEFDLAIPQDVNGRPPRTTLTAFFRDSGGQWWSRRDTDPVRKSREPLAVLQTVRISRQRDQSNEEVEAGRSPVGNPPAEGQ